MSNTIDLKNAVLGIEFGSTRIKAVLINEFYEPVATGIYDWENSLIDGYWTYSLDDAIKGLQGCYADLCKSVLEKYNTEIKTLRAIGISGMMHGYIPFDKDGRQLAAFRTWRNTCTEEAAEFLSELLQFNIPQRWSVAHLYQAILNGEEHTKSISKITTLAGYIHYRLTGRYCVGTDEASGMFPLCGNNYDGDMLYKLQSVITDKGYDWQITDILPEVLCAGEGAGLLTEEGAKLIDPSGKLSAGIPLCPPEGDAGTGMVATNSVAKKTGNISAGTSIFSMLVLEKALNGIYKEIDIVSTPDGSPVAMVHCNNCCSELNAWVSVFGEFAKLIGNDIDKGALYNTLYKNSLNGEYDCGGITAYNYLSGEHITGINSGKPVYFRTPDSKMTLANLFKAEIYSTMAVLKIGMDILFEKEKVKAEQFTAHGGLFKTEGVAQQALADALDTSIAVTSTSGEGGAWGIALLAAYMCDKNDASLPCWLNEKVFGKIETSVLSPNKEGKAGFLEYMKRYVSGLDAARILSDI